MNNWPSIRDLIDHPAQMIIHFDHQSLLVFGQKKKSHRFYQPGSYLCPGT